MPLDPPTPTTEVSLVSPQKGVTWAPDFSPPEGTDYIKLPCLGCIDADLYEP